MERSPYLLINPFVNELIHALTLLPLHQVFSRHFETTGLSAVLRGKEYTIQWGTKMKGCKQVTSIP